jgi:hypothetical protein
MWRVACKKKEKLKNQEVEKTNFSASTMSISSALEGMEKQIGKRENRLTNMEGL